MNDTQHWDEPASMLEITEVTDIAALNPDDQLHIAGKWVTGPFELTRILWTFSTVEADTGLVIRWSVDGGYQYAPVDKIDGWRHAGE